MPIKSNKELIQLGLLLAVGAIVGTWAEQTGWGLFTGLAVWVLLQWQQYRRIRGWSSRPLSTPTNANDNWYQLSYQPYRTLLRERARTQSVLDTLRELLTLLEHIPDGIVVLREHGEIESLNAAAKQMLGLSDQDIGLGLSSVGT